MLCCGPAWSSKHLFTGSLVGHVFVSSPVSTAITDWNGQLETLPSGHAWGTAWQDTHVPRGFYHAHVGYCKQYSAPNRGLPRAVPDALLTNTLPDVHGSWSVPLHARALSQLIIDGMQQFPAVPHAVGLRWIRRFCQRHWLHCMLVHTVEEHKITGR